MTRDQSSTAPIVIKYGGASVGLFGLVAPKDAGNPCQQSNDASGYELRRQSSPPLLSCARTVRPPLDDLLGSSSSPPDVYNQTLIHISEPTRLGMISYADFCMK